MSATTMTQKALSSLDTWRDTNKSLLKDLSDDQLCRQLPGACNHFLWTVGHLVLSYHRFVGPAVGAKMPPIPESYDALFGFGSTPSPDASAYPKLPELIAAYDAAFLAFKEAVVHLTDNEACVPSLAMKEMLPTKFDAVVAANWHEGWHGGQMSALRRGLGLKGIFG